MTHFADLPDPRSPVGRRHVLSDLLTIAICAVICGADGWVQVEQFGRCKAEWFRTFLALPHGIPSHDTFGRVFGLLDPVAMEQCFGRWVAHLVKTSSGKLISVDGKSLRRSFAHAWDASGMAHLVSAFVGANERLVLGQVAVTAGADEEQTRGNEITAVPRLLAQLLQLLDLQGSTVSIDAIGCQRSLARLIVQEAKADYVLALKDNQPTLHQKVKLLLDEGILENFAAADLPGACHEEVDGGHGRVETRRVWVTDRVQHLKLRTPWPGLKSVAAVERVREVRGKDDTFHVEREWHYYISSLAGCDAHAARRMAEAIRGHWGIENQLHWHLDVSFGEDQRRVRKDHSAENFSRLCRIALNLIQRDRSQKLGVKTKRLKAGWSHDYLLKLLTG